MNKTLYILFLSLAFTACNTTQKTITTTPKTETVAIAKTTDSVAEKAADTSKKVLPIDSISEVANVKKVATKKIIPVKTEVFNHSGWNQLLKKHVTSNGRVDYEGFRNDKGILRDYIASLGVNMPTEKWSQADNLAYWMNAYNAMTVDLIVRNLPLKSIKDIDKPWNQRLWKLGVKWYNLDEIEHQILRKMGDARIHFGINCASFSCPPLGNEAFSSAAVDSQLETLAHSFINDTQRNQISEEKIVVSKLFSWFAKDFKTEGSLIEYLNRYSETIINAKAKVRFMDYDWALNN